MEKLPRVSALGMDPDPALRANKDMEAKRLDDQRSAVPVVDPADADRLTNGKADGAGRHSGRIDPLRQRGDCGDALGMDFVLYGRPAHLPDPLNSASVQPRRYFPQRAQTGIRSK